MNKAIGINPTAARLIKEQEGLCNICKTPLSYLDPFQIDHRIPRVLGGQAKRGNLQVIHTHCHHRKSATEATKRAKAFSEEKVF